jgi:hypothetical protein
MIKITGLAVLILSLSVAIFGAISIVNANGMAQMLSLGIKEFEPQTWQAHWQVTSISYMFSGCIGVFAGIGIIRNKKWGFFTFALLLSMLLLGHLLVMVSGYAAYSFEEINFFEALVISCISGLFWYLYGRKIKKQNT